MVEQFAEKIADKLIESNYVENKQKDSYVYAMVMSFKKWISSLTIMLISVCFDVIVPTVIFLIFVFAIKKRSGGFHADTFGRCFFQQFWFTLVLLFFYFLL